jgi:hypothetical protein
MKKLIVVVLAVTATFGTFAQTDKQKAPTKKETATQVQYTCPMHPEVVSDKPGKCPKCGMTLVKKTGKPAMDSPMHKMPMHKMDTTKGKKKMTM